MRLTKNDMGVDSRCHDRVCDATNLCGLPQSCETERVERRSAMLSATSVANAGAFCFTQSPFLIQSRRVKLQTCFWCNLVETFMHVHKITFTYSEVDN